MVLTVVSQSHRVVFQALAGFLNGLRETSADGHHFADGFHLKPEGIVGALEFIKVPARHLYDNVVQRGFKIGGSGLGDLVLQLIEREAQGEFGGDLGDRISGGFGG